MKKLMMFLSLCGLVLGVTRCADVDYTCTWYFNVVNQTEYDITLLRQKIKPGEEKIFYSLSDLCGKNDKSGDLYPFEEQKILSTLQIEMEINGELVPDAIWKRKYWDFVDEVHRATYTLVVTNELLDLVYMDE